MKREGKVQLLVTVYLCWGRMVSYLIFHSLTKGTREPISILRLCGTQGSLRSWKSEGGLEDPPTVPSRVKVF